MKNDEQPKLGIFKILGRVSLVVHVVAGLGHAIDDDLLELKKVGIVFKDALFAERFEFEGDVEGPLRFRIDGATGADAEDLGDLKKDTAGGSDHFLESGVIDLGFQFEKEEVIDHLNCLRGLALPVQGSFFESINVGNREESGKARHAPKNHGALTNEVRKADRPRIHEDDLNVEDDEEHGDKVEFHAEARGSIANGEHATFVGSFLGLVVGSFFTKEDAEAKSGAGKTDGGEGLKNDGKVISQHDKGG